MVTEKLADRQAFAQWFGKFTTTRKYPDMDWQPEEPMELADLRGLLAGGLPLIRNPASRFSFIRGVAGQVSLYVDGEHYACEGDMARFAEQLCAHDTLTPEACVVGSNEAMATITRLYNQGSVAFELDE